MEVMIITIFSNNKLRRFSQLMKAYDTLRTENRCQKLMQIKKKLLKCFFN